MNYIFYILTLIVVILTSLGHILLKVGAIRNSDSGRPIYLHPISLMGYFIFAIVALLSIYAMTGLEMKVFFGLNSLTYVCIPVMAYVLLRESFTRNKIFGILLISLGVLVFNL